MPTAPPCPVPLAILDTLKHLTLQQLPTSIKDDYRRRDFDLVKDFLLQYTASVDTFNAYRREAERLLQWAWFIQNKSILSLSRQEMIQYIQFCQAPPPEWIGDKVVARFVRMGGQRVGNPLWRLFVRPRASSDDKPEYRLLV